MNIFKKNCIRGKNMIYYYCSFFYFLSFFLTFVESVQRSEDKNVIDNTYKSSFSPQKEEREAEEESKKCLYLSENNIKSVLNCLSLHTTLSREQQGKVKIQEEEEEKTLKKNISQSNNDNNPKNDIDISIDVDNLTEIFFIIEKMLIVQNKIVFKTSFYNLHERDYAVEKFKSHFATRYSILMKRYKYPKKEIENTEIIDVDHVNDNDNIRFKIIISKRKIDFFDDGGGGISSSSESAEKDNYYNDVDLVIKQGLPVKRNEYLTLCLERRRNKFIY